MILKTMIGLDFFTSFETTLNIYKLKKKQIKIAFDAVSKLGYTTAQLIRLRRGCTGFIKRRK